MREGNAQPGDFEYENDHLIRYLDKKDGVSVEDILLNKPIEIEASFPCAQYTQNEIHDYFEYLIINRLIEFHSYSNDGIRYTLCESCVDILSDLFDLFSLIHSTLVEKKLRYVRGPSAEEIRWLEQFRGKHLSDLERIKIHDIRKSIWEEAKNRYAHENSIGLAKIKRFKKTYENQINSASKIIDSYGNFLNRHAKESLGIEGLKELFFFYVSMENSQVNNQRSILFDYLSMRK